MTGPVSSPDLDLDAIRARLGAITSGWYIQAGDADWRYVMDRGDIDVVVARLPNRGQSPAHAEFIVHAPTDVASLLVLVGQLQEQLDAVRELMQQARDEHESTEIAPFVFVDELAAVLSGRKENHDG